MDLRKFYLENVSNNEYYYKFYDLIQNVNFTNNLFSGTQDTQNYAFNVYDVEKQ